MDTKICPQCHTQNAISNKFCRSCGSPLPDSRSSHSYIDADGLQSGLCPKCGKPIEKYSEFCMECGAQLKSKKQHSNHLKVLSVCLICTALVAGGGYYAWRFFFKDKQYGEPSLSEPAKSDYVTLETVELYKDPGSSESSGSIDANQRVQIRTVDTFDSKNEIWGQSDEGWLLLSKDSEEYLEPIKLSENSTFATGQEYVVLEDCSLYADPTLLNSQTSEINQGKRIKLEKVSSDQNQTIWGKIGNDQWLIVQEDGEDRISEPIQSSSSTASKNDLDQPGLASSSQASTTVSNQEPLTTEISITPHTKIQSKYSGPACAQMLLETQGIYVDQETLGQQMDAREGHPIDNNKVAEALTTQLKENKVNARYETEYLYPADVNQNVIDICLSHINKNLKDGYPSIVIVNGENIGIPATSTYALVSAMTQTESGEVEYRLTIPLEDECKSFVVSEDSLIELMIAPGFFCYVY